MNLFTDERQKERKEERAGVRVMGGGEEQRAAISVSKLFQRRLKIQMN